MNKLDILVNKVLEWSHEIWKDIEGYEGMYQVSSLGRVKSLSRERVYNKGQGVCKEKILSPGLARGYLVVRLRKEGKYINHRVHRLVSKAFIPNPNHLPEINHIDENRSNNLISNLEWCTSQYNAEYSKAKDYRFTSPEGTSIEVFNLAKFCRENNLYRRHMWEVFQGRRTQHKGYTIWKN